MIAADLINNIIPSLKTTDSVQDALDWMDEFRVSHLPIVFEQEYLGLVTESELLDLDPMDKVMVVANSIQRPFVFGNDHIYDLIKNIGESQVTVVPVIDEEENFLGIITAVDIIAALSKLGSFAEPGGVIILELNARDYSMSQIAQIIESNEARILSSNIITNSSSMRMEILLKIDQIDLTRIIAAFERYQYNVKASFHSSTFDEELKDRYNHLMNFLKM